MRAVEVVKDEIAISVEAHHGAWAAITITRNGTPVVITIDPEHRRILAQALMFGIDQHDVARAWDAGFYAAIDAAPSGQWHQGWDDTHNPYRKATA